MMPPMPAGEGVALPFAARDPQPSMDEAGSDHVAGDPAEHQPGGREPVEQVQPMTPMNM